MRFRVTSALIVVTLILSGCTSSAPSSDDVVSPSAGTILVEDGEGGHVFVNVTNETGAVVGEVLSDAGFGLPGARVTISGAEHGATTNETGWFQIAGVPPGERLVRAEHENYRTAESIVIVEAGAFKRLTITLVPAIDGDSGYRPHVHDYWAGRTDVEVIDNDFEFYPSNCRTTYCQTTNGYRPALHAVPSTCLTGSPPTAVNAAGSSFFFPEPSQLVWPGTLQIKIKIAWPAGGGAPDQLWVVWKTAADSRYNITGPAKNGEEVIVDVVPSMWDGPHQQFSLWRFFVCPFGPGETASTTAPRVFRGLFHVQMTLVRGYASFVDPPHPRFWKEGDRIEIANETRGLSCTSNSSFCLVPTSRVYYKQFFAFSPRGNHLVPPGTGYLEAVFSWTFGGSVAPQPFSLAYSPANVEPRAKDLISGFRSVVDPQKMASSRSYQIAVKPGEADSFYQRTSNWQFLWGYEGKENEEAFLNECLCTVTVSFTAYAVKDPAFR